MDNSNEDFIVRRLSQNEIPAALELAWKVFSEYESPDYAPEGTEEFRKCLHDEEYLAGIEYYGTFDGEKLIGTIGIRADKKHICFFFVDGNYHRKGIGTGMFRYLLKDYNGKTITLNSSPYGVPFCRTIGFVPGDEEKTVNGIRFTPMEYKAEVVLETERLLLREMNMGDYDALYKVLADSDNMQHYPYVFDERRVRDWIERNMERYSKEGFGLWAVCLKENGEMIGDCGLTLQNIQGEMLPEIGYHIRRNCQRNGYAKETAKAVMDWAFRNTDYPALYSYCKYTNEASIKTAEAIGMQFDREYPDEVNGITHVSVIYRRT